MFGLERYAIYAAIIVAFGVTCFVKGCEYEQDKQDAINAKAEIEAQAETNRRVLAQKEIVDEHRKRALDAVTDANRAEYAVKLLRDKLSSTPANPPATPRSPPSVKVGDILGDCAEEYRKMAKLADAAYGAGATCEKSYDSLANPKTIKQRLEERLKGSP